MWCRVGGATMAKEKKLMDVTEKVLESSIVTGKLRSFE